MNIRMIPIVALSMVLGLAACQEEEAEDVEGAGAGEVEQVDD